jgi:hypothetical protein
MMNKMMTAAVEKVARNLRAFGVDPITNAPADEHMYQALVELGVHLDALAPWERKAAIASFRPSVRNAVNSFYEITGMVDHAHAPTAWAHILADTI